MKRAEIKQAVFEAIGEASTTWSEAHGNKVFDSSHAERICNELMAKIEAYAKQSHPAPSEDWVEEVVKIVIDAPFVTHLRNLTILDKLRKQLASVSLPGVDKPEITFIDYAPDIKSVMLVKDCRCQCGDKIIGETVAWVCNICAGYVSEYKSTMVDLAKLEQLKKDNEYEIKRVYAMLTHQREVNQNLQIAMILANKKNEQLLKENESLTGLKKSDITDKEYRQLIKNLYPQK